MNIPRSDSTRRQQTIMKSGMGVFVFLGLMLALTILAIWPIFGVIALVIAPLLSPQEEDTVGDPLKDTSSALVQ